MTALHDAVVRIERMVEDVEKMVEDVEECISSHASECVVPMASAASALMMAGCLSTTDPTLDCRCGASVGGAGGDRPHEEPVATAMAHDEEEDPDTMSGDSPTPSYWDTHVEEPRDTAPETPWWQRGPGSRRFNDAMNEYPQEVLPHLRPPPIPSSVR